VNHTLGDSKRDKRTLAESPYLVVLADDDVLYRCVLKTILKRGRDLEVAGEAGDGLQLLALLGSFPSVPHLAIIDISMPNLGGIGATTRIKSAYPGMKVIIVSIHMEKEYVREALSAGADGYLLKEGADSELFSAIEKIRRGGLYISPILIGSVGV
jgi:DNA-binding NarL/FixJ family response regulator